MDFDNPKVYGDTSISDNLVYPNTRYYIEYPTTPSWSSICWLLFGWLSLIVQHTSHWSPGLVWSCSSQSHHPLPWRGYNCSRIWQSVRVKRPKSWDKWKISDEAKIWSPKSWDKCKLCGHLIVWSALRSFVVTARGFCNIEENVIFALFYLWKVSEGNYDWQNIFNIQRKLRALACISTRKREQNFDTAWVFLVIFCKQTKQQNWGASSHILGKSDKNFPMVTITLKTIQLTASSQVPVVNEPW